MREHFHELGSLLDLFSLAFASWGTPFAGIITKIPILALQL